MKHPLRLVPALAAVAGLGAVETELATGPHEVYLGAQLLSQHVEAGREYSNGPTGRVTVAGRLYNLGLKVEGNIVISDCEQTGVRGGEMTAVSLRADYLIETDLGLGGWFDFQLIPHYQATFNPYQGLQKVQEPHWVGVDGWFLTPIDGLEVGGNFDWDASGNHGWHSGGGFRQFIQFPPLDLRLWQVVNVGDPDYFGYLTGLRGERPAAEWELYENMLDWFPLGLYPGPTAPMQNFWAMRQVFQAESSRRGTEIFRGGITTVEAGAAVTLPNLLEDTYVTLLFEGHWWVNHRDRRNLRDTFELVIGAGVEYRFRSDYQFVRY